MSNPTITSLNMSSVNHGRLSQRFDLIRKLGQGTYGKVQLGINKMTGVEVALKTIKKCKIENGADLLRIKREISIMSCCNHPNIIHIYEVYENKEKIILVMEYAQGGELYDYLNEKKKLDEEEAKRIFSQISSAIYYCHKHMIVHRDLKLENILLDENNNAKIADFGLSNVFGDQLLKTFCGSPLYASPEIVRGIPYLGPEVDCWSLGVLLYTLVYGSMPFDGTHFKKLVKQITSGSFYEPTFKSGAAELIKALLTVDSKRRLNVQQVVSHPWLESTECQSISEEYCNVAPVKAEFLVGINKSDTLDEVSEISSTSIEENESAQQKTKPKPPRKSIKPESNQDKGQTPVIDTTEVKPSDTKSTKPIRNDKVKTDELKIGEKETIVVKNESVLPEKAPKPPDSTKLDVISTDARAKSPESKPNERGKTPDAKPKDRTKSPETKPKDQSKTPDSKSKDRAISPDPTKAPESKHKVSAITKKETAPKNSNLEKDLRTPAAELKTEPPKSVKTEEKLKLAKTETKLPATDTTMVETKSQTKPKLEEKPNEQNKLANSQKPESLKIKIETKRKSPVKESTVSETPKTSLEPLSTPNVQTEPAVILRNQRSTSTPTSEEASSPTTPVPFRSTERRNSKTKTSELIQNFTEPVKTDTKKPASKLNDIKKKFESGPSPKPDETGIGTILKRRKSIIESDEPEGQEFTVISPPKSGDQAQAQEPLTSTKPPPSTKPGSRILNLVIERESDAALPTHDTKYDMTPPSTRPGLKLIMPKPTPVSASPPLTKQAAAKKIGSLISKVKSNESMGSRERVIPIQFEDELNSPASRSSGTSGPPSRTGSISISILSGDGNSPRNDSRAYVSMGSPASTLSSPSYSRHNSFGNGIQHQATGGCQIMKSKREFIIPITIEERDGGDPTSNTDLVTRRNSSTATASSSGASSSSRVYSNRRHTSSNLSLLSPDSTDLEDDFFDDDDFLSSDALFSSLLQRVRGLRLSDRIFDNDKNSRRNGRWSNMDFKRN